jgi:hypothetical protein
MTLRSPRVATGVMFFVSGAVIGTWAGNVPYVRDRLDISTATIGVCLLAMAAGSVLAMLRVGHELDRRPSATMTRLGAVAVPLTGVLPVLAGSPVGLAVALLLLGGAMGVLDVSMNAHGVVVERVAGRPVMSSLHGGWSLGGLVGAGGVALGHVAGVDPRVETAIFCGVLLLVGFAFGPYLGSMTAASRAAVASARDDAVAPGAAPPGSPAPGAGAAAATDRDVAGTVVEPAEPAMRLAWPSRGALLLGTLCALMFVSEGAMTDWSALYIDRDLGSDGAVAAIGYAGFAAGMALGRFSGDAINRRIGALRLLRWGTAMASASIAAMLLIGSPFAALPALALAGLGVANGVPLLFSAAGRVRDMAPGPAIAAVSTMSYFGLLAGPPFLGFLAGLTSLPLALSTTAVLIGLVAVFAARAVR